MHEMGLICPHACGAEAAWADAEMDILNPRSLIALANHFRGSQVLMRPKPALQSFSESFEAIPDLSDVKGQETAKRALEVAAAGNHNLLIL